MSIASIALIVLAIHVTGPEVDEADVVTLHWFVQSRPEAAWTISSDVPGTYTIDGGDESIHVERLSAAAGSYAVIGRDEVGAIRTVGAVVYDDPLPVGWRRGTEDTISIPADEVLVAFRSVEIGAGSSHTGSTGTAGGAMELDSGFLASSFEVIRRGSLITVAHALSNEVVVLDHESVR